ncbi:unnamed protein product [Orchesella dallaii]|uniref:GCS light chain n=1 Tax=Orchesella dallaii TaxID=48710 RepID=A0ABP1S5G3_9HEXA
MESRELIIYSGNILNKAISLRKGNESNEDEIFESLKACIGQKPDLLTKNVDPLNGNAIELFSEDEMNSSHEMGDRQDLKVTLKLFLYSLERKDIIASIDRGLRSTSVDYLDNIILSFSGYSKTGALTIEHIQKAWAVLEDQVDSGKVKMIGLSDVDTQLFIQTYELVKVKPSIVQINLASCCVVPPELAEFCKQKSIQLLTHSDPLNVLPEDKVLQLSNILQESAVIPDKIGVLEALWVMRFQVHLKTRGVLATKGYVVSLNGVL